MRKLLLSAVTSIELAHEIISTERRIIVCRNLSFTFNIPVISIFNEVSNFKVKSLRGACLESYVIMHYAYINLPGRIIIR